MEENQVILTPQGKMLTHKTLRFTSESIAVTSENQRDEKKQSELYSFSTIVDVVQCYFKKR